MQIVLYNKYIGVLMKMFKENSPVVIIGNLASELEKYKKLYEKEKTDNNILRRLIQKKTPFEVRV